MLCSISHFYESRVPSMRTALYSASPIALQAAKITPAPIWWSEASTYDDTGSATFLPWSLEKNSTFFWELIPACLWWIFPRLSWLNHLLLLTAKLMDQGHPFESVFWISITFLDGNHSNSVFLEARWRRICFTRKTTGKDQGRPLGSWECCLINPLNW